MSRFRFELARSDDDLALRRILAATPMPGRISLRFEREPSYFESAVVEGRWRQVVVARDGESERIVGFGSRAVVERYVNGQPRPIGYLSGLRLLPEFRGRSLVARGYAFFRRLHADGRAPLYLTTITADNRAALATIAAGRGGLPTYHDWGTYHTIAVSLRPDRRQTEAGADCEIRTARPADRPCLLEFLRRVGPRRQFFVEYGDADFGEGDFGAPDFGGSDGMFRGLQWQHIRLAWRDGRVVGSLAGWDQSAFRQTWVESYAPRLRWARRPYNTWALIRGLPRLPPAGRRLEFWTAALPLAEGDDPRVFAALLEAARRGLDRRGGEFLLLGMHARDPLLPVVRRAGASEYVTRVFVVCWPDGEGLRQVLDDRVPHLELGQL